MVYRRFSQRFTSLVKQASTGVFVFAYLVSVASCVYTCVRLRLCELVPFFFVLIFFVRFSQLSRFLQTFDNFLGKANMQIFESIIYAIFVLNFLQTKKHQKQPVFSALRGKNFMFLVPIYLYW